jgi:translation initiation factor IF-3
VIGPDGNQLGILPLSEARRIADEYGLDLVEVAPMERPPVCRIMDYSRWKYEQSIRAREARKKQAQVVIKEMKLRPKIDPHDYAIKMRHVERFLRDGAKVKVTVMFRGREMARTDLGAKLLERVIADLEGIAQVEQAPRLDGRNMTLVVAPSKALVRSLEQERARAAEKEEAVAQGQDEKVGSEAV